MADKYSNSPTNQQGKEGVRIAIQWLKLLLKENSIVECEDWQDVHIEGKDIRALEAELIPASVDLTAEVASWLEELKEWGASDESLSVETGDCVYEIGTSVYNIEVKNYSYTTFTLSSSDPDVTCGHVYFPRQASQKSKGISWLQRICFPELDKSGMSVMPAALVLIYTYDHRPIFSIAFEDIPVLRDRIADLIQPLTIEKLNTYTDQEAAKALMGKEIICRNTLLYIPFSQLYDIATVTLLGHCLEPYRKAGVCPADTQKAKLRHLAEHAYRSIINLVEPESPEKKALEEPTNAVETARGLQL